MGSGEAMARNIYLKMTPVEEARELFLERFAWSTMLPTERAPVRERRGLAGKVSAGRRRLFKWPFGTFGDQVCDRNAVHTVSLLDDKQMNPLTQVDGARQLLSANARRTRRPCRPIPGRIRRSARRIPVGQMRRPSCRGGP